VEGASAQAIFQVGNNKKLMQERKREEEITLKSRKQKEMTSTWIRKVKIMIS